MSNVSNINPTGGTLHDTEAHSNGEGAAAAGDVSPETKASFDALLNTGRDNLETSIDRKANQALETNACQIDSAYNRIHKQIKEDADSLETRVNP